MTSGSLMNSVSFGSMPCSNSICWTAKCTVVAAFSGPSRHASRPASQIASGSAAQAQTSIPTVLLSHILGVLPGCVVKLVDAGRAHAELPGERGELELVPVADAPDDAGPLGCRGVGELPEAFCQPGDRLELRGVVVAGADGVERGAGSGQRGVDLLVTVIHASS